MKLKLIKIAATGLFVISTTANAEWSVTRIIDNPITSVSSGTDINDSGMVVGVIKPNSISYTYDTKGNIVGTSYNGIATDHPFITGVNGTGLKILDIEGRAYGINNIGQVVGSTPRGAFMTGPNGEGITYLDYAINAFDINNLGQVVGETKNHHAFITGPNGVGMTDLGTLGGDYSAANAINDSGQVVGWSTGLMTGRHAFITGPNGSGMTDLGAPDGEESIAYDINDSGQVVGGYVSYDLATGTYYQSPFITDSNGSNIRDPGIGGGGAYGINNSGQVVIYVTAMCDMCSLADGVGISLIFDHGTVININNQFLPQDRFGIGAVAINNSGQIAGTGSGSATFPYLLSAVMISFPTGTVSPIPEPATYTMLLAGLGLLGFMVLRRKKSVMKFKL